MLSWIERTRGKHKKLFFIVFLFVFLYTILHFLYSGIYFPIKHIKLGQIQEEIVPLVKFLQGDKFIFDNPRQYGPFFIFVITPFMIFYKSPVIFANMLLLFSYLLTALSFYICYTYIFISPDTKNNSEKRIVFWSLLFLWLNFSPLLYIITVKNVEIWELSLICFGFMMYTKRRYSWVGFSFAAATLIKMLPALFIYYYFFKERKVFLYSMLWMGIIMLLAHITYGPSIGLLYFPFLLSRPLGSQTWAVSFFENISLKGFIYKLASFFKSSGYHFPSTPDAEQIAFLFTTFILLVAIIYLALTAIRKNCSRDEVLLQFAIVSTFMILLAPIAAWEYTTLLLFAYSAGLYFIFYKNIPRYLLIFFGLSYFMVGNFIPLSVIVKVFPFQTMNIYLGNTIFEMSESYKAYCVPLLGVILLAIFFIVLWHKRELLENTEYNQ